MSPRLSRFSLPFDFHIAASTTLGGHSFKPWPPAHHLLKDPRHLQTTMAHKHNRRRVRPRGRRSHTVSMSFDMFDNFTSSFGSTIPISSSISEISRNPPPTPSYFRITNASVASKHWQNRYMAWQNRDLVPKIETVKMEAEQIKLFGGEPGDDVGLCYKMLEVFQGMNWIDSLD